MANENTYVSFCVGPLDEKEVKQITDAMKPDGTFYSQTTWVDLSEGLGFEWSINVMTTDTHQTEGILWVHSDDADVEIVAAFAAFVAKIVKRPIGFTYAVTCSKPRPNAFGGGAYWTDGESSQWMDTWTWLKDCG